MRSVLFRRYVRVKYAEDLSVDVPEMGSLGGYVTVEW